MGRKKLGIKEKRAKAIEKEIKQLERKGYDVLLATEGKSIEELSRSKKSYERFKSRKQVARERKKVEAKVKEIKIRFQESKRRYIEKKKEIRREQEERRIREEEKRREEESKKKKDKGIPLKDLGYMGQDFGLDDKEEFKMKEYLTNMLTERMGGVDRELVDKVKDIIYNADIMQLDRIADFFPAWDAFKEFYTYNDDDVYGSRNVAEKTEVLRELIRYMGE